MKNKIIVPIEILSETNTELVKDWIISNGYYESIFNNGGVYFIRNKVNHKIYVGSTYNFYNRIFYLGSKGHRALITNNKHWIINNHNINEFEFILKLFPESIRLKAEYRYVKLLETYREEIGYNKTSTGRYGGGLTRDRYYITNGSEDKLIPNNCEVPEGFVKGRSNGTSEWTRSGADATIGTHYITDGKLIRRTSKDSYLLPEGFYPGKDKSMPTKVFIDTFDKSIHLRNKILDELELEDLEVPYSVLDNLFKDVWYSYYELEPQLKLFYKINIIVKEFRNREDTTYWITRLDGKSHMFRSRYLPENYWPGKYGSSYSYRYLDNIDKLELRNRNDRIYDENFKVLILEDTIKRLKSLGYSNTTARNRLNRQLKQFFNIELKLI